MRSSTPVAIQLSAAARTAATSASSAAAVVVSMPLPRGTPAPPGAGSDQVRFVM